LRLSSAQSLSRAHLSIYFYSRGSKPNSSAKTPVVGAAPVLRATDQKIAALTHATLPQRSQADVAFMQGMIMHHAQAIEMTALISSHTEKQGMRLLGARISSSQSSEIRSCKRWLAARGEPISMTPTEMPGMECPNGSPHLMPGMLTAEQNAALRKANSAEFDPCF